MRRSIKNFSTPSPNQPNYTHNLGLTTWLDRRDLSHIETEEFEGEEQLKNELLLWQRLYV